MENKSDKFVSMIGFAKRAGKIVYGADNVRSARRLYLLAVSDTASSNLTDAMKTVSNRKKLPLLLVHELENIVGGNCKALGLSDVNMAQCVIDYVKKEKTEYSLL